MATGQYLADLALALAERGHEVTVVASRRAYDDPARSFPKQETWRGIRVLRIGSTAFGKRAKWRRAVDFASFLIVCLLRLLRLPRQDVVVALTSPPLISIIGACLARLRGRRFIYWVMDLNPDEAIAAGWLRPKSVTARLLEGMSRFSMRQAATVIALDRFMCQRITDKGIPPEKVLVLSPWCQDQQVAFDPAGRERFRKRHALDGKFVVMYSGNHSPCHPLDTLLQAADRLSGDPEVAFCFVGGGTEWRRMKDKIRGVNGDTRGVDGQVRCLPYQPPEDLSASLSAADLHVVVMGEPFVGIVHPCKVYNILLVGAPVLYIGPAPSHVTELLGDSCSFAALGHDDIEGVLKAIQRFRAQANGSERSTADAMAQPFSQNVLLPRLLGALEDARCQGLGEKDVPATTEMITR